MSRATGPKPPWMQASPKLLLFAPLVIGVNSLLGLILLVIDHGQFPWGMWSSIPADVVFVAGSTATYLAVWHYSSPVNLERRKALLWALLGNWATYSAAFTVWQIHGMFARGEIPGEQVPGNILKTVFWIPFLGIPVLIFGIVGIAAGVGAAFLTIKLRSRT